jgi:biotin---protein ligase
MNVVVCASSASHGLSNALRSLLSPFYTVQSILPVSLATQPWTPSCALLVLLPSDTPPAPFSLPSPAHEAIQQYISAGGRILGIGLGATLLPHRQVRERFGLWDASSGTTIVPQYPQAVARCSIPSSIILPTGALLSGLQRAGVSFVLTHAASDVDVICGHWEEPVGAIAGIQVPVGSGRAAFWGISAHFDGIEDTENVIILLRYVLSSLGLSVPPETPNETSNPLSTIPRYVLPQFLLHPRGKRNISETMLQRLGLSATAESSSYSEPMEIKDRVDTFHFHKVATLEHGARLVAKVRASADVSDAPRLIVVLPDVLPTTGKLTPRFDPEKYFAVLAEVRGDQTNDADSWGVGEALFYGEAVTSTQTMLERYAAPRPSPIFFIFDAQIAEIYTGTPDSWRPSQRRSSQSRPSSSLGAAVAPTRGCRHRDACNSPSSSARHCAHRDSPHRVLSSYNTSLRWPSSVRAATSARWGPSVVHAYG